MELEMVVRSKGVFFGSGVDTKAASIIDPSNTAIQASLREFDKALGLLTTMGNRGSSVVIKQAIDTLKPVVAAVNDLKNNQNNTYASQGRLAEKIESSTASEKSTSSLAM